MNKANDVIVVEDRVDAQCVRHVHLMSNAELPCSEIPFPVERGSVEREAGVWHYRASYPYRGVLDVGCVGNEKKFRRFVVWNIDGYKSLKQAFHDAWQEYSRLFGGAPQFGFVLKLPTSVENGVELGGMTLMEAEWMLDKCVAVGGRL